MKLPRSIAFLGDIHCGSHWGLWPLDRLPERPRHVGVRYLMECFDHALSALPKKIDLLVLTGDLIDGQQRKSSGTGLFSTKLSDQVDGAIEVLAPLVKRAATVYRVDGTPYHEDFHGALRELDYALGVSLSRQVIDLDLDGEILNVAHHPTGGSTLYKGTAVDREMLWADISATRGKVHRPRWIVRAHKHNYLKLEDVHTTGVSLPCWELSTPHAKKQAYWRFQPDLGVVWMERDPSEPGGYRIRKELYDPPKEEPVRYGETETDAA